MSIDDPRIDRTKGYPLTEILFLVLAATVSGLIHLTQIQMFGEDKLDWFRSILPYENGIPSHDTIGRVLGLISPDELERAFGQWIETLQNPIRAREKVLMAGRMA